MLSKLGNGWVIVCECILIIIEDISLLCLGLLGGLISTLVFLTFLGPISGLPPWHWPKDQLSTLQILGLLGLLFFVHAITLFFDAALVSCGIAKMEGKDSDVFAGLKTAALRIWPIFKWAIFTAALGLLLKIAEYAKSSTKITAFIFFFTEFTWSIVSFFALPIIIVEGIGPVQTIQKSEDLCHSAWGEQLAGRFSINQIYCLIAAPFLTLIYHSYRVHGSVLNFSGILGITLVFICLQLRNLCTNLFKAALYHYAVSGEAKYFSQEVLSGALEATR
jgi:hypothetical protein